MKTYYSEGEKYARWTLKEYAGKGRWLATCDCGNEKEIFPNNAKKGLSKSCGCHRSEVSKARLVDLTGLRFGILTVISRARNSRNGHARWVCQCECGIRPTIFSSHLIQGNTKSCGCMIGLKGPQSKCWTGIGEISGAFWNQIIRGANGEKGRRKISMTLTHQQAWELFIKQNRTCALTGLPIAFPRHGNDRAVTASLDRIDSGEGYTLDNVQWVHKDINRMKNVYDQQYFIDMCRAVAENN